MIIILLILTANIAKYEHYVNYPSKFLTATQPQLLLETTKFQLFPKVLTMDMLVAWPLEPGNKRKRCSLFTHQITCFFKLRFSNVLILCLISIPEVYSQYAISA